jgi:hypothetical protein
LSTIVTGDETWIHHFKPKTKRQSMEWHHTTSPWKKKFNSIPSASKIMATVFWDCEGVILIDVLPWGQTINSDIYVETLKKRFRRVHSHKRDKIASSPRQCEVTHKSAYPRGHHKASVDCPASSTLQPRSGSFQLPSFHSFERCNPRKQVWGWRGSHFRSKEMVATDLQRSTAKAYRLSHVGGVRPQIQKETMLKNRFR